MSIASESSRSHGEVTNWLNSFLVVFLQRPLRRMRRNQSERESNICRVKHVSGLMSTGFRCAGDGCCRDVEAHPVKLCTSLEPSGHWIVDMGLINRDSRILPKWPKIADKITTLLRMHRLLRVPAAAGPSGVSSAWSVWHCGAALPGTSVFLATSEAKRLYCSHWPAVCAGFK